MSWTFVKKMPSGDNVIKFIIPPFAFAEGAHGGSASTMLYGSRDDINPTAYAEALAMVNDLNKQHPSTDFRHETMPKTYVFEGQDGGGAKVAVTGNWRADQSFSFTSYDYYFQPRGTMGVSSADYTNPDITPLSYGASFACVVEDTREEMYLGVIFWVHYLIQDGAVEHLYASVQLTMFDAYVNTMNLWQYFHKQVPIEGGGDPYAEQGQPSAPSGPPQGTQDDYSEEVPIPTKPPFILSFNHFISVWAPELQELNDFADYLWGNYDKFDQNKALSKLFANPQEAVLSLHMLPFTPDTSTAIEVTVGRFATGVNMKPCAEQFHDIDCGSLDIEPYWGNYLDYNPYTKFTLVLPFVGQVSLDPDEVMGETVSIMYRVDVVTGAFVCFVKTATKVLGQYAGNCAMGVPVTSADYSRLNAAIIQSAATVAMGAGAALEGGMAAPAGFNSLAGGGEDLKFGATVFSAAQNVQNSKMHVAHSGGLSGAPGFMGIQKPYLIIHRAVQSVPKDANGFYGYPSNVTFRLNALSGFTSVRTIKLDGVPLTDAELSQLRTILAGGVYINE